MCWFNSNLLKIKVKAGALLDRMHLSEFLETALKPRSLRLANLTYIGVPKKHRRSPSSPLTG